MSDTPTPTRCTCGLGPDYRGPVHYNDCPAQQPTPEPVVSPPDGHQFVDHAHDVTVTVHFGDAPGVEHPGCAYRAEVFPELDAFFCRGCRWNGRISGEWFMQLLTEPSWADGPAPDPSLYMESEVFVAGALSTMPPFASLHPAWTLPFARRALAALTEWEPSDA